MRIGPCGECAVRALLFRWRLPSIDISCLAAHRQRSLVLAAYSSPWLTRLASQALRWIIGCRTSSCTAWTHIRPAMGGCAVDSGNLSYLRRAQPNRLLRSPDHLSGLTRVLRA